MVVFEIQFEAWMGPFEPREAHIYGSGLCERQVAGGFVLVDVFVPLQQPLQPHLRGVEHRWSGGQLVGGQYLHDSHAVGLEGLSIYLTWVNINIDIYILRALKWIVFDALDVGLDLWRG